MTLNPRLLNHTARAKYKPQDEDVTPLFADFYKTHDDSIIRKQLTDEIGENALSFIIKHTEINNPETFVVSTTTIFNITYFASPLNKALVNIKRINDVRRINKFFEAVNYRLTHGGQFIGCCETKNLRKDRILSKYPWGINYVIYSIDFIIKRVFPKFALTKGLYFFLTRGQNRVLTRAEALGRLVSCGFEIREEQFIDGLLWFVARKVTRPAFDLNPTYGPLVRLSRVGKSGKIIKVLKMRTMHPYAEYLQEYVYELNHLDEGGKFKNDFRVSTLGRIMRTFWLDELPMLINLLRGDMKLFGVRPISRHYFELYTPELQKKRIQHKPGLIPPFYVHYPRTLEEIMASEMQYLEEYEKHPFRTDWKYFWKAIYNIVFKKYRGR